MRYKAPYDLTKKDGDQGWDIRSTKDIELRSKDTITFPTGVHIEFEDKIGALVVPRSGLSSNGILCHLGLVDSSYRGEIGVNLTNLGDKAYKVHEGDRIGQLVFFDEKVVSLESSEEIVSDTERGSKGFGSSGR